MRSPATTAIDRWRHLTDLGRIRRVRPWQVTRLRQPAGRGKVRDG